SRCRHTMFSRDWTSDVCSSDLNSLLSFTNGNVSRASVLISAPRFCGTPYTSPLTLTFHKSDFPYPPGRSDAKYNVRSSLLKAGCAVLKSSPLIGNSRTFCQLLFTQSAL